jgi:glycosyltransferase involved in cell wall biosynthesis
MEAVWDTTRVLLMPSLWCEAWGLVVVEAQIRGIPVLSSDAGAIPEAKLGLPHIIPVKPLQRAEKDSSGHPIFDVPTQDMNAWVEALTKVMTDQEEYERLSDLCAEVTGKWALDLDARAHEKWMLAMMPNAKQMPKKAPKKEEAKTPSGSKKSNYLYCIPPGKLHKITEANIL